MTRSIVSLDSCAILHLLTKEPRFFSHLNEILEEAKRNNLRLVVSEISVAECVRFGSIAGTPVDKAAAEKSIREFFNQSYIQRRGVTSKESEIAVDLIKQHDLGACDALIAATAFVAGAETLYSTDGCSPKRKPGKLLTAGKVVVQGRSMAIECPKISQPTQEEEPGNG